MSSENNLQAVGTTLQGQTEHVRDSLQVKELQRTLYFELLVKFKRARNAMPPMRYAKYSPPLI